MNLRKTLLGVVLSSVAAVGTWGNSASAQAGLAEAYCQAHMPILQQALSLRRDGIPIDIALSISDSARSTNVSLWSWLRGMTRLAYEDPNLVAQSLRNGRAQQSCVEEVRGY